jgi:hypothetical protein
MLARYFSTSSGLLVPIMYRECDSENNRLSILDHELGIESRYMTIPVRPCIAISDYATANPPLEQS